ncbi:MAG: hypothetical protein ACLP7J_00805 [Streptosporangiaceae bacterium]
MRSPDQRRRERVDVGTGRDAAQVALGGQWRFDWDRLYTRDEWLELVPTSGGHSRFPPGKLDELLAGIGTAIDAAGGSLMMCYTAVVVTATRAGAA